MTDCITTEFQSKAQPIESRCVAFAQSYHKPKPPINVPRVIAERYSPSISFESATTPTNATTTDESPSRGTYSKRVPVAGTIDTNDISRERHRSRPNSSAIPGSYECVDNVTTDTGPTSTCLTCGSVGATRLDSSDKEYGPGLELVIGWYGPRDDGSGYATERVKNFV
jgi:hypothetical protein